MAFILDIPRHKNCVRCGDQDNYIFPYHVIRLWVDRMNIQRESGGGLGIDFSLIPLDAQAAVAGNNSNKQHTGRWWSWILSNIHYRNAGAAFNPPLFLPRLFGWPRKLRIYEAPPQPPIPSRHRKGNYVVGWTVAPPADCQGVVGYSTNYCPSSCVD